MAITTSNIDHVIQQEQEKQEHYREEVEELRKKVQFISSEMKKSKDVQKSFENLRKKYSKKHKEKESKYHHIGPETRSLIVDNVSTKGKLTYQQAAELYNISTASVARIVKESKSSDQVKVDRRGRKSPITVEVLIFLLYELDKDCTLTLEDLVERIETHFDITTSVTAIQNALSKMQVTWKNVLPIPIQWNSEDVISKRSEFLINTLLPAEASGKNIIYVDETGFNLHNRKKKGRAVAGQPAVLSTVPRGKKINVIAALSKEGIAHYQIVENFSPKSTNAEHFRSFVLDLAQKIPPGSVLIMDNAKIHRSHIITSLKEMLNATYQIDIFYLPPYSPFINPIEYYFNDLKNNIASKEFFNRGELLAILTRELANYCPPEKAASYFSHCKQFYSQIFMRLPFEGKPLKPNHVESPNTSTNNSQIVVYNSKAQN